ncbi:MAG: ribosome maturation factor RimP [Spirosomataceae bacterium]
MISVERVEEAIHPFLDNGVFFVVDIKITVSKIRSKILILVDSDEGISIDQCGDISRKVGIVLDEIIETPFVLEVSSPGIDTPLKLIRHYKKNIGRNLKITLQDGQEIKGKLLAVEEKHIEVQPDPKKKKELLAPQLVQLEDIRQATVQVSFK